MNDRATLEDDGAVEPRALHQQRHARGEGEEREQHTEAATRFLHFQRVILHGEHHAFAVGRVADRLEYELGRDGGDLLELPAERVLQRTVDLPLAAAENLREVLGFEMDRHTPFKAEDVAFDYHIVSTDRQTKRLLVDLTVAPRIEEVAAKFYGRTDFLYLGRGINYPIALEGALKLKEISYIHAEGYPAGEMKHGPISLIDEQMPVVTIAPHDHVFEKMIGNVQEAKARGGSVIALTTESRTGIHDLLNPGQDFLITVPDSHPLLTPVLMVVPLQLLAYHIAIRRGCDVDQPRNLAKSVTVE